jgi:aminoglycoside 2'-N-acetyltransferase I
MMKDQLTLSLCRAEDLTAAQRAEIIELCAVAYEENFDTLFELLPDSTHVLAYLDGHLVSHAEWVTRWLAPEGYAPLRTAYVEAVATLPGFQGRGFATTVLQALSRHIQDFDMGALSPSEAAFYERLGWELWRGPLAIRTEAGLTDTPDEEVMILRLANTPTLNLDGRLTAEWRDGELW